MGDTTQSIKEPEINQEIKVDTQNPQISHPINGTPGENGWYISDIQVSVAQIDPVPSSGIQAFQTSLDGTIWTDYTTPLDFSEGTYVLQMRAIDNADNQGLEGLPLNVDTTPPTINGTLTGQLGSGSIYISPVQAEVSVSDATSGIALTEYSLDGSAWRPYTAPLTINDGVHELQFRTKDTAGLVSYTVVYKFSVDMHGPNIKLPSRWYIWEKGDLFVKDQGSKIASVSYEIHDSQGRWKKVERTWSPNTETFSHDISWDRVFADGVLAPVGSYPVHVTAIDNAGHSNQKTALIIIPPVGATPLPTFTPTPTLTQTPIPTPTAVHTELAEVPTSTPTPFVFITPTPTQKSGGFFGFGSKPKEPFSEQDPNLLLGITAAAVTGAFLATQRKKERVLFGSAPKEAKKVSAAPNILEGAQAIALVSAFTAKLEEERQRRAAEKARKAAEIERLNILNYQAVQERIRQIARAREAARRARQEAKKKKNTRHPLQDLWDRNGAAIYEANKSFKVKHGRNMNARTRRRAIKAATVKGVFSAGAYAGNLNQVEQERKARAARTQAAVAEIDAEKKIGYVDPEVASQKKPAFVPPDVSWKQADLAAADKEQKLQDLQAGLQAFNDGRKAGEEKTSLQGFGERAKNTFASARDNLNRFVGGRRGIWNSVLLSPIQTEKKESGRYLFRFVQERINTISSLASKIGQNIPRNIYDYQKMIFEKTGFNTLLESRGLKRRGISKDTLTERLKSGLLNDITKSANKFKDSISNAKTSIVDAWQRFTSKSTRNVARETSEVILKEGVEGATEVAAKTSFRQILKTISPGVIDAVIETGFNIYDYNRGDKKNETEKEQKIVISSTVDFAGSLATGALAAGAVALTIAAFGVSAPLWVAAGLTVLVGGALEVGLEALGWKEPIKVWANQKWDKAEVSVGGWLQNAFTSPPSNAVQPPVPNPTPQPIPPPTGTPTPSPSGETTSTPDQ